MKVLLAIDGSQHATAAARLLSQLSFTQKPQVTIISVTPDPIADPENLQLWIPECDTEQIKAVSRHQEEIKSLFAESAESVDTILRRGNVSRAILDAADETGADLIVLGAVGHSAIGRMILGSVSDNVATHAKCSVLVIRPPTSASEGGTRVPHVSVAYDGSAASNEALQELAMVNWNPQTRFFLTSVALTQDFIVEGGMSASTLAEDDSRLTMMRQKCEEALSSLPSTVSNREAHVVQGPHAGDAIVTAAEETKSELIVLGDGGHTVLHDWIVGSTTKYVLRHASCSVWISRHHRRSAP